MIIDNESLSEINKVRVSVRRGDNALTIMRNYKQIYIGWPRNTYFNLQSQAPLLMPDKKVLSK